MTDPLQEARRLSELEDTIREALLELQGWLEPGSLKWSRDGLDALRELAQRVKSAERGNERLREALLGLHERLCGCDWPGRSYVCVAGPEFTVLPAQPSRQALRQDEEQ